MANEQSQDPRTGLKPGESVYSKIFSDLFNPIKDSAKDLYGKSSPYLRNGFDPAQLSEGSYLPQPVEGPKSKAPQGPPD